MSNKDPSIANSKIFFCKINPRYLAQSYQDNITFWMFILNCGNIATRRSQNNV